jgi:hypothetical protein
MTLQADSLVHGVSMNSTTSRLYYELSHSKTQPKGHNELELDARKYHDIVLNYGTVLIRAAEGKPYPSFKIHLSDLSLGLKKDLLAFQKPGLQKILRDAVLRICQDIDDKYNYVFPEDDPVSNEFRINLTREITMILQVELIP